MASTDWRMKGVEFGACNCNWGCPCQFNALPSKGHCTGGMTLKIEEGYFGDTRLDGVVWGMIGEWPGAIHEGNGTILIYIDEKANPKQRKAIVDIASGKHSDEGTLFHIFSAMAPNKLEPVYKPIEFQVNAGKKTARIKVPGVLEVTGEPIRNPVTNDEHHPRLVLSNGFEFKEADFASSDIKLSSKIKLDNKAGHGHFARIHWGPQGYLG